MVLPSGTKLGPYEIVSPLGAGGMGEVYRATDVRLARDVAIKILPAHLSSNSAAKQRFELEAKVISGLNHPNICTLYDVGHQDGLEFIVMEYLAGETLETRLMKGPLSLEQVLDYGSQIAHGLDKAHRSGIIHRDLKPANIMLTRNGAKLLDFGLAKAGTQTATATDLTAGTVASSMTHPGVVLGTFPYMSPEQVQGKSLDARSDIFSLGAVLYELVTGRKAFDGKSPLNVASSILEKEPESILVIAPRTPASLDHVIRRCLAKDPDERWQTARDLASELEWLRKSGGESASAAHPQTVGRGTGLIWALCGLMAAGLLAGGFRWQSRSQSPQTDYFLAVLPFTVHDMAIAPNGHTVAAVGFSESERTNFVWLYEVGGKERKLAETEGASFPFWSPDGKALGFFAEGKLKKVEIAGGPVQVICDAPAGRGGTWNKDGVIVFSPSGQLGGGLYRVAVAGGTANRITVPDSSRGENSHRWPIFLPDGKHFLYLAANVAGVTDPDAIFVGKLDSNEKKLVARATGNPAYAVQGYLLFCREKTLYRQRFDAAKLEASGEAVPLLTDVSYRPRILHNAYAVSDTGALVALRGSEVSLSKLVWRDRKGNEIGTVGNPNGYANAALAPDGKVVGLERTDEESQNTDLWTYDLQRDSAKRLTFDPSIDADPIWSPDGKKILFASSRGGLFQLYIKSADGGEDEKLLPLDASDRGDKYPTAWSSDGKYILYERTTQATALWTAEMPGLKTSRLLQGPGTTKNGQFSPDGRWLAYTSNESGKWEIYITSFPELRGKWQVSNTGGTQPRWRGDGKELFYLASDGKMTAVQLTAKEHFDSGQPIPLFQASAREQVAGSELITYDVAKDGQRFLIDTQMEKEGALPMMVILNWNANLER
jgi:serine/threonine protein kinase/Tol biopolymer transport system component